ncbi:MAG: hypothetical protein QGG26_17345 [Candidatus Undinarchaeales archaeon]|nr:hypothetical protein [Candidatus Undinarchaeales archaeon]
MKGLYLNVPKARERIEELDHAIGAPTHLAVASREGLGDVVVNHHPLDWPDGPIREDAASDTFAAACGWFVFRDKLGDLAGFASAFREARERGRELEILADVRAGEFLMLLAIGDERFVITDPFGLRPHFTMDGDPCRCLAPSPWFIKGDRKTDPIAASMLRERHYLYGTMTAYDGVERVEPGSVIGRAGARSYFDYGAPGAPLSGLADAIGGELAAFGERKHILPLSGGLDSRLLLATGDVHYAYTFGPRDTGDRPVARRFAHLVQDHWEFSLLDLTYPKRSREAGTRLLDGICDDPFYELLPINERLFRRGGEACITLDGFCGDVLQRGTYMTYGGVIGSLAKLLPWLTTRDFDPLTVLRRRNAALSDEQFEVVARIFREKMGRPGLDGPQRLTLFELMYGRGVSYIFWGGLVADQFYTNVRAFFLPAAFRTLFSADLAAAAHYRNLRPIWSALPRELTDVATYSGFKPLWNPHVARASMLAHKALAHLGVGRTISYTSELDSVVWR